LNVAELIEHLQELASQGYADSHVIDDQGYEIVVVDPPIPDEEFVDQRDPEHQFAVMLTSGFTR
jgi:hypothetical protein